MASGEEQESPELLSLQDADLDGMLEVVAKSFERWPSLGPEIVPRDHLERKCNSSPGSPGRELLATQDGRPIGAMIPIERRVSLTGEILPGQSEAGDCLLPEFREQGRFSRT